MKVLTIISGLSYKSGGPSRSVPMLVRGLAEAGVDITLMVVNKEERMNVEPLQGTSAKLRVLEIGFRRKEVEAFIREERFDLIQIQSLWAWHYHQVVRIARRQGIPYIITTRGMLTPWSLSQSRLKKALALRLYQKQDLQRAACIFTTAEMEAVQVRDLGVQTMCSVIPNGINTDDYPCRETLCGRKEVLFLSRIHRKKGLELLIEAWERLQSDFSDWTLTIAGNGDEEYIHALQGRLHAAGLEDVVKIIPPVFGEEKIRLYQRASLFVLPSYSENFGMVVVEAMSCGLPVITTDNTPWEVLNEKDLGWCIPLSVESLGRTLCEAMGLGVERLSEKGRRAGRWVRESFDYRRIAGQTKELYEGVLRGEERAKRGYTYLPRGVRQPLRVATNEERNNER